MYKTAFLALVLFSFSMAPAAVAADMPRSYKKCKACHGLPGKPKKKKSPDLIDSKMTLKQYIMQVRKGTKWEGRPPIMAGYEKKKMPGSKRLTDDQIKEIFDYVVSAK